VRQTQENVGDEVMRRLSPGLLDLRPARWALIYGLPGLTCLLAGMAIFVSRMDVHQDVHVLAQRSWQIEQPTALRIVVYDRSGQLLRPSSVEAVLLSDQGNDQPLAQSGAVAAPALDLQVSPPPWPPGTYQLHVSVQTQVGQEAITAPVELIAPADAGKAQLFTPPPPPDRSGAHGREADLGDFTVEVLPHGAGMVPNLDNLLFLRTTDNQAGPRSARVELEVVGGSLREPLPEEIRTDSMGLAVLVVHPLTNALSLDVRAAQQPEGESAGDTDGESAGEMADGASGEHSPSTAPAATAKAGTAAKVVSKRVSVATTPAQMVMRLDRPVVDAEHPASARVNSLHAHRPVYLDLYRNGRWAFGRTGLLERYRSRLAFPGQVPGLTFLQAYSAPLVVGYGYAAHHLYVRPPGETDAQVLTRIARELQRRRVDGAYVEALLRPEGLPDIERFELAAAFLLSRLDRGYHQPPLLVSSQRVRSAELQQFQREFKQRIAWAIALIGLVVAGLMAYGFSVAAVRARRQRALLESDNAGAEDDLYVTTMGRPPVVLDRFRTVLQIMAMVGVVAVGFLLIAVLISVLTWKG
jgi:hypothetical protein